MRPGTCELLRTFGAQRPVEVPPHHSEQLRQQCNSSSPTSRNFEIDASAAVGSQRERRIQLQGHSPYTTRTQGKQPSASVGSRPTPSRRRTQPNTDARRLATHLKPRKTPLPYRRWCSKARSKRTRALVKPQSSKAASAERDRQETSISELSWAAPRSSIIASTRRPTQGHTYT